MGSFGTAELLLVLIAVLVLFGAKRLPTAARSLGQSMRIFKAETKGLREQDDAAPAHSITAEPIGAPEPAGADEHRNAPQRP